MLKEQKGITLVALVITIIVLLILAGVSISLVMGDNGVLTQAQGAVVAQKIGGAREKVESAVAAMEMKYKTDWAKNTSAARIDTYKGKDDSGNLNTTLVAFEDELEANGLKSVAVPAKDSEGVYKTQTTGAEATIDPAVIGSSKTLCFTSDTDSFVVTMTIDSSTGAVTFSEFLAWNGSKYSAE